MTGRLRPEVPRETRTPSLRQHELDQVRRVTALPGVPAIRISAPCRDPPGEDRKSARHRMASQGGSVGEGPSSLRAVSGAGDTAVRMNGDAGRLHGPPAIGRMAERPTPFGRPARWNGIRLRYPSHRDGNARRERPTGRPAAAPLRGSDCPDGGGCARRRRRSAGAGSAPPPVGRIVGRRAAAALEQFALILNREGIPESRGF